MPKSAPFVLLLAVLVVAPVVAGVHVPSVDDVAEFVPARIDATGAALEIEEIDLAAPVPPSLPPASNIGPGSRLLIRMGFGTYLCTASFVFNDTAGKLYLGTAGHCLVPAGKTATHGPGADYDPAGTRVAVCVSACYVGGQTTGVATGPIRGVYANLGNVSYARQTLNGDDLGNDFGIVEIPTSVHHLIRLEMPVFRGPSSVGTLLRGDVACHYGYGTGVGEVFLTQARVGVGVSTVASQGEWRAELASAPGDSGSAVAVCVADAAGFHGRYAIGTLTHIAAPYIVGTTIAKGQQMATQAGLTISPVLPPA